MNPDKPCDGCEWLKPASLRGSCDELPLPCYCNHPDAPYPSSPRPTIKPPDWNPKFVAYNQRELFEHCPTKEHIRAALDEAMARLKAGDWHAQDDIEVLIEALSPPTASRIEGLYEDEKKEKP